MLYPLPANLGNVFHFYTKGTGALRVREHMVLKFGSYTCAQSRIVFIFQPTCPGTVIYFFPYMANLENSYLTTFRVRFMWLFCPYVVNFTNPCLPTLPIHVYPLYQSMSTHVFQSPRSILVSLRSFPRAYPPARHGGTFWQGRRPGPGPELVCRRTCLFGNRTTLLYRCE